MIKRDNNMLLKFAPMGTKIIESIHKVLSICTRRMHNMFQTFAPYVPEVLTN